MIQLRKATRIGIGAIVGMLLGLGLALAAGFGYFDQWRSMPALPTKAIDFVAAGRQGQEQLFGISIRTEDNAIWGCTYKLNNCWVRDQVPPQYEIDSTRVTQPCKSNSPEFFPLTNPPRNVTACIQATLWGADWGFKATYALDDTGNAWQWYPAGVNSAFFPQTFLYLIGFGCIAGITVGSVWAKQLRKV